MFWFVKNTFVLLKMHHQQHVCIRLVTRSALIEVLMGLETGATSGADCFVSASAYPSSGFPARSVMAFTVICSKQNTLYYFTSWIFRLKTHSQLKQTFLGVQWSLVTKFAVWCFYKIIKYYWNFESIFYSARRLIWSRIKESAAYCYLK